MNLLYPSLSDRIRYYQYRRRYDIDPGFRFNGDGIVLVGYGKIRLGAKSYIGAGSVVSCKHPGYTVSVGKRCQISHNVGIYSNTMKVREFFEGFQVDRLGDVEIGDGCWVGMGSYIGPGVSLPPRTIVPANSVVTRSPASADALLRREP